MAVIAFDLTPGKLSSAVFNGDGGMEHKEVQLLFKKQGNEIGTLITEQLKKLISICEEREIDVHSIGISVPGIWNRKTKRVWAPNVQGWENYPLEEEIKSVIDGYYHLKIDNDRTCSILGEIWKGEAKGAENAVFLTIGSGIGAGIMVDGKVIRGKNDIAGAIGWLAMGRPFHEKYKLRGYLENQASSEGMLERAKEWRKRNPQYQGILKSTVSGEITLRDIFEAYKQNDSLARTIIKDTIELWGMTTANVISLFNPEIVVFGGSLFGPASRFIEEIIQKTRK